MLGPPAPPLWRRLTSLLLLVFPGSSWWWGAASAALGVGDRGGSGAPPVVGYPCAPGYDTYPFCNTSLPVGVRARDMVSRLQLEEKIRLLSDGAAPVPRLGLTPYEWWSESLHGLAPNGPGVNFSRGPVPAATVFPQVLLQAAAFNRTLWGAVAGAVAVEARAMYNVGQAGLTFWAPNVNIFRDPRWGRGQETPGEDPMLTSAFAVDYVRGFQFQHQHQAAAAAAAADHRTRRMVDVVDGGSSPLMLSACCKHYTAYDLDAWANFSRYSFNAQVTEQDMRDTYQPPFRSCIREGGASCLMCSYNAVNGVPVCASRQLLRVAREKWGLQGYVTSDCNAVATIYEYQRYVHSPEDAVADALKAGVDINCGGYYTEYTASAMEQGKVGEEDVDRALVNLFSVQLRLGLFDGDPRKRQFGQLGPRDVCTAQHQQLALEAARQGIVLLKNDGGFLPLNTTRVSSLAVIGPAANSSDSAVLGGDYTGSPCNPKSLYEGLQGFVGGRASFARGCVNVACSSDEGLDEAVGIAREADVAVVVAGLDLTQEDEDRDRMSLLLPGKQKDLVVAAAAASGLPIVLVLTGGGPLDVSFAKDNPRIASILWVGYPGEAGGRAVAQAIFGELNPGGRLPVTWYPESFADAVPMNDMHMRPDPSRDYPGRTYRFYTGEVVYPFGHGLSYSSYSYELVSAPRHISVLPSDVVSRNTRAAGGREEEGNGSTTASLELVLYDLEELESCEAMRFSVVVSVTNRGVMDGSHTVLLFSTGRSAEAPGVGPQLIRGAPRKQLIGFQRVQTTSGGAATAEMVVHPCEHLSTVDERGERVLRLGEHTLMLDDGLRQRHHSLFLRV